MIASSSPVKAPAYLYVGAEAAVVEELLAPDVGADERELAPVDADAPRELLLQRPHRALAGGRRTLGVHHHRMLLPARAGESLRAARPARTSGSIDVADHRACPTRWRRGRWRARATSSRSRPQALVLDEQRRDDARQRAQRARARIRIAGTRARASHSATRSRFVAAARRDGRARLARSPQAARASRRAAARRGRGRACEERRELALDHRGHAPARRPVRVHDRFHARRDVTLEDRARDLRKLMPRSSIRVPSGTEMSAVTRTRSSCSARRSGRNATMSRSGRPVRSASSRTSRRALRTCSGRYSVASGSSRAGICDSMPGFQGPEARRSRADTYHAEKVPAARAARNLTGLSDEPIGVRPKARMGGVAVA